MTPAPPPREQTDLRTPALALAFGLAVLWLFLPAAGFPLVDLDDGRYLRAHPAMEHGLTWPGIRWAFRTREMGHWTPVLWLSFMADTTFLGGTPGSHHLVNILLHALNAALVFLLIRTWTRRPVAAMLGAALFAVHPLRVEAVAWISARKDVLSTLWALLAIGSYVRSRQEKSRGSLLAVAAWMTPGLMTKPTIVALPLVFLALDIWPLHRLGATGAGAWKSIREKAGLWLLAITFALLTYIAHDASGFIRSAQEVPLLSRIPRVILAFFFYLEKTFWPRPLYPVYPELAVSWSRVLPALAVLSGLTVGLAAWARAGRAMAWAGWLWFIGMLLPVIGLVRFGVAAVADRFAYFPAIGLSLIALGFLEALERRGAGWARAGWATGLLAVGLCAGQTRQTLPSWRDSETLLDHGLRGHPTSPILLNNRGHLWLQAQQYAKALPFFDRTLAADPGHLDALHNKALALGGLGREDEARALLKEGLRKSPDHVPLNFSLGMFLLLDGRAADAAACFRRALEDPAMGRSAGLQYYRALVEAGDPERGRVHEDLLRRWGPEFLRETREMHRLYWQLWREGQQARAWSYFRHALELDPDNGPLLNNLAWVLATDPHSPAPERAVELAERALRLAPEEQRARVLDTLAAAHAAAGQWGRAVEAAGEAVELERRAGRTAEAERLAERLAAYRARQAGSTRPPAAP